MIMIVKKTFCFSDKRKDKLGITHVTHVVAGEIIIPRPFSVTLNKTTFLTKLPPGSSSLTCFFFSKCC